MRPVLTLACLLALTPLVGHTQTQTVPLRFAYGSGCLISPEGAVLGMKLLRQQDPDLIYAEAEAAEKLAFVEGQKPGTCPQCGGGTYIHHATRAEFPLAVKAAGKYQGWARVYLPVAGSWSHLESMDAGAGQWVRESERQIFGKWFWSKLGAYDLKAGEHRFILHNWLGGARLDAVYFTRNLQFDPIAYEGAPYSDGSEDTGLVYAAAVLPSGVKSWGKVSFEGDLHGGAIAAEASTDRGKTWRPAAELPALATAADGRDALQVRFTLQASATGLSPVLKTATVAFELAPQAEAVLENRHYRIAVARHTGALAGIENRAGSVPMTPLHLQEPLLGLVVREPGATEQKVIPPAEIACVGASTKPKALLVNYSALEGKVLCRAEMIADDTPLCRWRLTIENRSALEIIRVDFPLIGNAAAGAPEDDECIVPQTGGARIRYPATAPAKMVTYMGGGSMGWMDLGDSRAGLYVSMQDQRLTTTELECAPAPGQRGATLSFRTHTSVAPGQTKTRDYVVGVHQGDWHWGADRYREWAYSWMKHPANPEWVKWSDGWTHGSGTLPFGKMGQMVAWTQARGLDYLQYWAQMADGIDQCCGNFPWPAPALGGEAGFRQGIADVHKRGGHVTGYMNCQAWTRDAYKNERLRRTPKTDLPAEALSLLHGLDWFEANRLFPLSGKPVGYYERTMGWYLMCPASQGFLEHLRFWIVDMYTKRYGADGVYLDQAGATAAKPCYNLGHGHDDIGAWGWGSTELQRLVAEQGRRANPDFIMAIEGCGDALGQYANLHLVSGLTVSPEVYHYTFPDHILISGFSNSSPWTVEQRIGHAFLNGDRFDVTPGRDMLGQALQLRRRVKHWLYPGRFMDTVGMTISKAEVLGNWTRCDRPGDRAIVLTFYNEANAKGATCALQLPQGWERPGSVHVYDLEGNVAAVTPQIAAGRLTLAVPASTMSTALVMYAAPAAQSVDLWAAVTNGFGGTERVRLQAVNLGGKAVTARATVAAEAPIALNPTQMTMPIPPRGTAVKEIGFTGVEQLVKPVAVRVSLIWPGGQRQETAFVRPLLLNGALTLDDNGDDMPDYWTPGGDGENFPYGLEEGAFWIQGQEKQFEYFIQHVRLRPNTKYHFAGDMKRSAAAKGAYMAVVEFVGERGYRVHGIGTDPEAALDQWQRFETDFTTGADFRAAAVYLYNYHSTVRAWYRAVRLGRAE
jgi:hypothetical protein